MMTDELQGSCHCGSLCWHFDGHPRSGTICNCTICRRYGAIWAYGYEGEEISVSGRSMVYIRGDETIGFHFCPDCGCVAYWRALSLDADNRRRIAVNLRMTRPAAVAAIQLQRFDGLDDFTDLDGDGRRLRDIWFR